MTQGITGVGSCARTRLDGGGDGDRKKWEQCEGSSFQLSRHSAAPLQLETSFALQPGSKKAEKNSSRSVSVGPKHKELHQSWGAGSSFHASPTSPYPTHCPHSAPTYPAPVQLCSHWNLCSYCNWRAGGWEKQLGVSRASSSISLAQEKRLSSLSASRSHPAYIRPEPVCSSLQLNKRMLSLL